MRKNRTIPRAVARKIMERGSRADEPVVVTFRDGKPSRVFGRAAYEKMVALPNQVKPWERRKDIKTTPDPLGAVDAEPPVGLSRKDLYPED